MIKLIKLCFVCCLILRATFVGAAIDSKEAYEALQKIENEIWYRYLILYDDLCKEDDVLYQHEESITSLVTKYLAPLREREAFKIANADSEEGKSRILDFTKLDETFDFSDVNLGEVIFNFYRILQCKVDNRDEEYKTGFIGDIGRITKTEQEKIIDPYFLKIFVGKNLYHFCLDYNGKEESMQPGNCCLRQDGEKAREWCISENPNAQYRNYKYNALLNNNDHCILQNLLLCLEVSRRKVVDPNRFEKDSEEIYGFEDEFFNLPILGAIVIGLELMNDQIIDRDDFFVIRRKYCFFSGHDREEHIKNLLQTYCCYKNFQTVDQFLEEIQRLYKQFVGLKVTDRLLYLDAEHKSVFQKYTPTQGISFIKNTLNFCKYHIVDINSEEHSLWFAILQNMNTSKYYYDRKAGGILSDKDFRWESKKESQVKFLKYLEKIFQQKFVILDANVTNCAKWLFNEEDLSKKGEFIDECCYLNGAPYKQAIILLWRGNRWQAVLPN